MKRGMARTTGWLAVAGALCLAGCAGADGGKKETPKAKAKLVGRVASVPTGRGFVLIQSYGTWAVPAGEPVFSCGDCETDEEDGRLANLRASGERMGQFVAADVRSGEVAVGDAVYYRPEKETQTAQNPGIAAPQPTGKSSSGMGGAGGETPSE